MTEPAVLGPAALTAEAVEYDRLQRRHVEEMWSLVPEHQERIRWPIERVRAERERRLRRLLHVSKERSPWHAARLAHVDVRTATEADLTRIPPMTKDEMMSHFDAIVTDSRLTRRLVEDHISQMTTDTYLLGQFHAVATGGSSGRRGVFVYDWDGFLEVGLALSRFGIRDELQASQFFRGPRVTIAAETPVHMTVAVPHVFHSPTGRNLRIPVSRPVDEIVDELNLVQPAAIIAYPSILHALLSEAQRGRLTIAPRQVSTIGEPLMPELRKALEAAWGRPVLNVYGTAEGVSAASCGDGPGMHLNEDLCVFEPVDAQGRPVPPRVRATKLYVTNLSNLLQPLIRYELTDEVTLLEGACTCGSGMRRIDDIQGRMDDMFEYGNGVVVHPVPLRSLLYRERSIVEYQVRQTRRGVLIAVRLESPLEGERLRQKAVAVLAELGLDRPEVEIREVTRFERPLSGKLKRFIPMSALARAGAAKEWTATE